MKKLVVYVNLNWLLFLGLVLLIACNPEASINETVLPQVEMTTAEVSPTMPTPAPTATTLPTDTPIPPTDTPIPPATETPKPAEVTVVEDVLYAAAVDPEAQDQHLDIYVPGSPGNYPIVLWAHGSDQDKTTGKTLGRLLAKRGIVTVSVDLRNDYEPQGQVRILREVLEDAECALRFIAGQTQQYGADPEGVIWVGYSYGGWLGSQISFGRGDLQRLWDGYAATKNGPSQQVSCTEPTEPAEVTVFIASSMPLFSDFWLDTQEENNPTSDVPELQDYAAIGHNPDLKVRLIYGKYDEPLMSEGSALFATVLEEAGYDIASYPQSGAHSPYFQQMIEQILAIVSE